MSENSQTTWQGPITPPLPVPAEQQEKSEIPAVAEAASGGDLLRQLWYAIKLIVIPLLFACITCLADLPTIFAGYAYLPASLLWFIAVLIVLVALVQGIAIHFTRQFPGMWVVCTMGGGMLLLLVSLFALSGPLAGLIGMLLLVACTVYLLRRSIHPVPEEVVDIVFSFEKCSRTLSTGFNLLLPWEKVAHQVNVQETHWNCPPQKIQLSREEDVVLRALISYQVMPQTAHLAATKVKNWEESLRETFVTTLQSIATVFTPDDFLNWRQSLQDYQQQMPRALTDSPADDFSESAERREAINDYLCQYMRAKVISWGIQINWVNIRDIELVPHAVTETGPHPQSTQEPQYVQSAALPQNSGSSPEVSFLPNRQNNQNREIQLSEEILIKAYKEVQDGKITDPEAIRGIAAKFEAVARDPHASSSVSFDVERAVRNLYTRARKFEELTAYG